MTGHRTCQERAKKSQVATCDMCLVLATCAVLHTRIKLRPLRRGRAVAIKCGGACTVEVGRL
jgi:hypothetical protein